MNHQRIIKFLLVGGFSTVLNYLSFVLLFAVLRVAYIPASIVVYCIGMVLGYFLNRTWSFVSESKAISKEFVVYLVVYLFSLLLNIFILKMCVETFNISPLIGNVVAIAASTVSNYVGCVLLVFKKNTDISGLNQNKK